MGDYFRRGLNALKREKKPIKEVRGMGLMIGVHLTKPVAMDIHEKCREKGLLIHTVGETILRILPALIVTKEQIDEALGILSAAMGGE
jgi:acetylornithine/succinyldiaminopimelate/putrescine aminotransferase